jgi:Tol biopolymer transport system component
LGTAAYMSPEQAKGRDVDRRTDIFAFGAVLYEMLTGHQAFAGEDVTDILGAVLKVDPDWMRLPAETPPGIRRLLKLCLQKDLKKRRQTATDVRIDIEQALSEPAVTVPVAAFPKGNRWIAALAVAVVFIVLLSIPAARHLRETPPPSPREWQVQISVPPTSDPTSMAVSSDGQKLAFVSTSNGQSSLWWRSSDSLSVKQLPETDGAGFPFWSWDNRSIGFFSYGRLRSVSIDGGAPKTIAQAPSGVGGAWNKDDVILIASLGSPILRISKKGDEPVPATRLEALQGAHYFPQFLPDGRHFLYWAVNGRDPDGIYIGQLDGPETHRLGDAEFGAVYSQDHLFFVRHGDLLAQLFDQTRMDFLEGSIPFRVAGQVTSGTAGMRAAISASADGPIAYRTGPAAGGKHQLRLFDRAGHPGRELGQPFTRTQLNPAVSPNGNRVALFRNADGNVDIWILDANDAPTRFTTNSADDVRPIWSPNGNSFVFSSNRNGIHDLYQKSSSNAGSEETPLLTSLQNKFATDWSGHYLIFDSIDPKNNVDIWALDLDGDKKASFAVVNSQVEEHGGQLSTNSKWIAYVSMLSGRYEVYVRPFLRPGEEKQISSGGGDQVRWAPDGNELFYVAPDGQLFAAKIGFNSNDDTVEPGPSVPLFQTHMGDLVGGTRGSQYFVSKNEKGDLQFLMNTLSDEMNTAPINLILNFKPKP